MRPAKVISDPGRDAVCMYLSGQASRYPELDLQPLAIPPGVVADPRDEALAHQIAAEATGRWITLGYIAQRFLKPAWTDAQPELKAAILAGAAQILLLDRVPSYAAVDHAVGWTRGVLKAGASKVVNAVLRRIAELAEDAPVVPYSGAANELPLSTGMARRLRAAVFPDEPLERVAMATAHPRLAVQKWGERWGLDVTRAVALHSLIHPPVIVRTAHAKGSVPAGFAAHSIAGHHVFTGTHAQLMGLLNSRDDLWVQDPASSRAVGSVQDLAPRLVIDLCAGQGTKTRQLAATFPDAEIIACDPDPRRAAVLAQAFERHRRVRVATVDDVHRSMKGKADLVLLDVPCSNSGVLARRPEAKYRLTEKFIAKLVDLQRTILTQGRALLAPRGTLVYSTCSLEPAENEDQAAWACRTLGFSASGPAALLPGGVPGGDPAQYHDGAFSAVLKSG